MHARAMIRPAEANAAIGQRRWPPVARGAAYELAAAVTDLPCRLTEQELGAELEPDLHSGRGLQRNSRSPRSNQLASHPSGSSGR
jgi:hypothetical protein